MDNLTLNNLYENFMKTDIYEKNNKYYLEMDLPGYDKNNIKINYHDSYLTIMASKNERSVDSIYKRKRLMVKLKGFFILGIKRKKI